MKQLRIKFGVDPTGKTFHLGRTVPLLKLKDFQDQGHKIVLIIGDFTARVGDTSDKTGKRPILTKQQINENLKDYLFLMNKIINVHECEVHFNSEWLEDLSLDVILELQDLFTVQQMLKRRTFKERINSKQKGGSPISFKEFSYPILQGYDSYAINADVEVGGEDQIFNMNAGRDVQKYFGMKQQEVVTVPLIFGTDGKKMSTTDGNVINITDEEKKMFDAVMSIKDDQMMSYWESCTRSPYVNYIKREMKEKRFDWRNWKKALAKTITEMYYPKDPFRLIKIKPNCLCKNHGNRK